MHINNKRFLLLILVFSLIFVSVPTKAEANGVAGLIKGITSSPAASEEENVIDVQFMSFGSEAERLNANTELRTEPNPEWRGNNEYVTTEDGIACLKLMYSSAISGYRCTPWFTEANSVDSDHKYARVTYMTSTNTPCTVTMINPANGNMNQTIIEDTSVSNGEWVTSAPVNVAGSGFLESIFTQANKDVWISFNCGESNAEFYLKEITFFETEEDAYDYHGDEPDNSVSCKVLNYGIVGNAGRQYTLTYGYANLNVEFDDVNEIATVNYGTTSLLGNSNYYIDLAFASGHTYTEEYRFMRVLYSAKNPEGVDAASMTLVNWGNGNDYVTFEPNLVDTDGFVLSETVELSSTLASRFASSTKCGLGFNATVPGGEYSVKAVYFFKNAQDANALNLNATHSVTIENTNISEYSIVIPSENNKTESLLAESISNRICELTGNRLDIVLDDVQAKTKEIIIGRTNRVESNYFYDSNGIYDISSSNFDYDGYQAKIISNKLVFASPVKNGLVEAVRVYLNNYLYKDDVTIPSVITLTAEMTVSGKYSNMGTVEWQDIEDVSSPINFTDTFDTDEGYWTEESGEDNWSIENAFTVSNKKLSFGDDINANTDIVNLNQGAAIADKEYNNNTLSVSYKELSYAEDGNANTTYGTVEQGTALAEYASNNQHYIRVEFNQTPDLDDYKYIRVLYSAQNPDSAENVSLTLYNMGNGNDKIVIQQSITDTDGFVLSNAALISDTLYSRFVNKSHNRLYFEGAGDTGEYKVKAIYFFNSEEEAEAVSLNCLDRNNNIPLLFKDLSYAEYGNANTTYGTVEQGAAVAEYISNNQHFVRVEFNETPDLNNFKYIRVLYSAENIATDDSVSMSLYNMGNGNDKVIIQQNISNTDGFVLSNAALISDSLYGRFISKSHNRLYFEGAGETSAFRVKAIYFFNTLADAEYADLDNLDKATYVYSLTIPYKELNYKDGGNANATYGTVGQGTAIAEYASNNQHYIRVEFNETPDLSNYKYIRVLYSAKNPESAENVSLTLYNMGNGNDKVVIQQNVNNTNGFVLSDAALISNTLYSRFVSKSHNRLYFEGAGEDGEYKVKAIFFFNSEEEACAVTLNSLYSNSQHINLSFAQTPVLDGYKYIRVEYSAQNSDNPENVTMILQNSENTSDNVVVAQNVENTNGYVLSSPVLISDTLYERFLSKSNNSLQFMGAIEEDSYKVRAIYFFNSESDSSSANLENYYVSGLTENAVSYLHVYEKNVSFETDIMCVSKENHADMGLMLRYSAENAYVKAGYDFDEGEWYVDSCAGTDFECYRIASTQASVSVGQWYNIRAEIRNSNITLYVNDVQVLSSNLLTHFSPGRVGVFSRNAYTRIDNVDIFLLSGQGRIMPNVVHSILPEDYYIEGGSAVELMDGTLVYQHHNGTSYRSTDNGKTWNEAATWTSFGAYSDFLRLDNGNLITVNTSTIDGVVYIVSNISSNDGATWTLGGPICTHVHSTASIRGGNVNDKFTQMSDGRIFYCLDYGGRFSEVYYSDDNGITWTKSTMATNQISGNETETYFGESKIMETASGKLRLYNSWNEYGCIVYSESEDNGVSWGPIQRMENFVATRSSMQFVRDSYADNDTTYYMVWVYDEKDDNNSSSPVLPRARLALAKTTDGVNWAFLGDIWRYETSYTDDGGQYAQIVDPFIKVTDDYVIVGSGVSEEIYKNQNEHHERQRQHIWSIKKDTLSPYDNLPSVN